MSEELEVLKVVTGQLEKANIPYLVSGSMAANYYTVPRMTRDIDIVVELKISEVENFVRLFQKDFMVQGESIKEEIERNGMFNLIHKKFIIKIDFILLKESHFQNSMFSRRQKVSIQDQSMWFISAEDLILAKLSWAKDSLSDMQLNDVRNIIATRGNLDLAYIEKWISDLE